MIHEFRPRSAPKPPEPPKPTPSPTPSPTSKPLDDQGTILKIFDDHDERVSIFEVDADGNKLQFRGHFNDRAMAFRYISGGLKSRP